MSEVTVVELDKPMSQRELDRYDELKEVIVSTIAASFYKVGKAIEELQRDCLYRGEFRTIEACCKALFDIGKSRLYQLVDAATVYDQLSTMRGLNQLSTHRGDDVEGEPEIIINALPANEYQIRPLVKVAEQDRPKVWSVVLEMTPEGKNPSNALVTKVVNQYLNVDTVHKIRNTQTRVAASRQLGAEMKAALDALLEQVRLARSEGYDTSSRLSIVQALDGIRRIVADDGDNIPENRIVLSNREKLLRNGFTFVRTNTSKLIIEQLSSEHYDWRTFETYPDANAMEEALEHLLSSDAKHLRD